MLNALLSSLGYHQQQVSRPSYEVSSHLPTKSLYELLRLHNIFPIQLGAVYIASILYFSRAP